MKVTTEHTAVVRTVCPATGVRYSIDLTWQTQRHYCCGQTWAGWDAERWPSVCWPDGHTLSIASYSECKTCGSLFTPDVEWDFA